LSSGFFGLRRFLGGLLPVAHLARGALGFCRSFGASFLFRSPSRFGLGGVAPSSLV
jgi:hypothetical protein